MGYITRDNLSVLIPKLKTGITGSESVTNTALDTLIDYGASQIDAILLRKGYDLSAITPSQTKILQLLNLELTGAELICSRSPQVDLGSLETGEDFRSLANYHLSLLEDDFLETGLRTSLPTTSLASISQISSLIYIYQKKVIDSTSTPVDTVVSFWAGLYSALIYAILSRNGAVTSGFSLKQANYLALVVSSFTGALVLKTRSLLENIDLSRQSSSLLSIATFELQELLSKRKGALFPSV